MSALRGMLSNFSVFRAKMQKRRKATIMSSDESFEAVVYIAWLGLNSAMWQHSINNHAMTILDELDLLRGLLPPAAQTEAVTQKLSKLERLARKILAKPVTPPWYEEKSAKPILISRLLHDHLAKLRLVEPYRSVAYELKHEDDEAPVRASPKWLVRAFDLLIDNAIAAMGQTTDKRLIITITQTEDWVYVALTDRGAGVPEPIRERLFKRPIPKTGADHGLGVGLLIAQFIIQTFGGEIRLRSSDANGTTFVIRLPAAHSPAAEQGSCSRMSAGKSPPR